MELKVNLKRLVSRGRTHEMNEELEAEDREEAAVGEGGGPEPGQGNRRKGIGLQEPEPALYACPWPPGCS